MNWLSFTIISYFLSGLSATIDKVLLKTRIPNPILYAFYTGIFSIFVLILAPFGFSFLSIGMTLVAFGSGVSILIALMFFYAALQKSEASIVVPFVGAISPVVILLFSGIFQLEIITVKTLLAILFFIVGGILLAAEFQRTKTQISRSVIIFSSMAAFFLALTFFFSKVIFQSVPFVDGFIWTRLASFVFAVSFLFVPYLRGEVMSSSRTTPSSLGIFLVNKGIGATSFLLLNLSIALGPVSIVNALRGAEYLSVFIISLLLTFFAPHILQESFRRRDFIRKALGIMAIGIGFIFLWFNDQIF